MEKNFIHILKVRVVFLLLINFAQPVVAENLDCSAKACFPRETQVGKWQLPLLGAKLFRYYVWTAYSIALYAPHEARSIEKIQQDVPKRLVLEYKRDFSSEDFANAADKILKDNPNINLDKIREGIEQINKLYQPVKEGDRYALEYEPGRGTTLYLNEKPLGTVPGEDFGRDYLGIWLSEYPLSEDLRDALLGR